MTETRDERATSNFTDAPIHRYPPWALRFWHGMDFFTWMKLLAANRFAVEPFRWSIGTTVTITSMLNSFAGVFQHLLFDHTITHVQLKQPPLFVLGHWRSGTTLLHELLMLDSRHTCPTTYQCLAPHHFLWSEWFLPPLIGFLLPAQRPMDDMPTGLHRPQEDEFALANLGVPSPYQTWAFPNHGPVADEYLDLQTLPAVERERWKRKWFNFVQRIALKTNRRIVLKSPTHTARVKTILELFPDAKFIHIVRDPLKLFPSTVRLWKSLSTVQGFQRLNDNASWIEGHILDQFVRMYECFEQDRELVPEGNLVDIRYEELVKDQIGQMRWIYEQLDLGDFAPVEQPMRERTRETRDYQPNKYQLPPEVADRVRGRWAPYFQRYGYET